MPGYALLCSEDGDKADDYLIDECCNGRKMITGEIAIVPKENQYSILTNILGITSQTLARKDIDVNQQRLVTPLTIISEGKEAHGVALCIDSQKEKNHVDIMILEQHAQRDKKDPNYSEIPMREIKAAVKFANAGIGEFYARHANVKIVVAIELETDRADLYKSIYPDCEVINGDVTKPEDMERFLKKCREENVELLLASPPCQGHSKANQSENKDEDIRNRLILNVTQTIDAYPFKNVLIENVPDFLDYQSDTILPEFGGLTIREYLEKFFAERNFKVDINQHVNAREYSETPQNRTRAIVLASKISNWSLPPKLPQEKWKTIEDAIGDLPSLESGERGIIKYENDPDWKDRLDILKYHNAPYWKEKDVEVMKHTATGCSAFDNQPPYRPTKKNGEPKEYYRSAYRRPKWSDAFPCVLQGSDGMGGMVTCHPGRKLADGTYSDARAYTILELLRSYDLPDNFPFPAWASDDENLLRDVLGEAFAPLLVKNILLNMPR